MIEAVAPPSRSRLWTDEDARNAYDLLTGTVRNEDGTVNEDEAREPQWAKFGTYPLLDTNGEPLPEDASDEDRKAAKERAESKARTQGMSLDRKIESLYQRRFGVSVWVNQDGDLVGALNTKPPVQRKAKDAPLTEDEVDALHGTALDEALEARGLSKAGNVADKKERLLEHAAEAEAPAAA